MINKNSSIDQLLRDLVLEYGKELYTDKQRLYNFIADLYTGEEKLKRVYRRVIMEDSISLRIHEISLKPFSERAAFCNQLSKQIAENNFWSEEFGQQITQSFIEGLLLLEKNGDTKNIDSINKNTDINTLFKLANQGNKEGEYYLGYCYYYGKGIKQDYYEAVKWYKLAAEQGNETAQYNLGECYYYGEGVKQDYNEAVKWYKLAAEQGDETAQCNLGYCYKNGQGVKQDYNEAVKWYKLAAEQGNETAQNNLGVCYENGEGIKQDYNEAVKWYKLAAEQGYARAQNNLGICYEYGRGVKQDYNEAVKWYKLAAEQGNIEAKEKIERCFHKLSLKTNAQHYYNLGLNITSISDSIVSYDQFAKNISKAPSSPWKHLSKKRQSKKELNSLKWERSIGVGCITGYKNLIAIDIDNCVNINILKNILQCLGLSEDYEWVSISGSQKGFHIIIRVTKFPNLDTDEVVSTYSSNKIFTNNFEKIELLWKTHVILPPSKHKSGGYYQFLNGIPQNSPKIIDLSKIQNLIDLFLDRSSEIIGKSYNE
ncbi:MAG: SEL1-like repeat protein [Parabacteroides sp.]|nr:SEL1-like repeat protein [Parabacteroides sp.]